MTHVSSFVKQDDPPPGWYAERAGLINEVIEAIDREAALREQLALVTVERDALLAIAGIGEVEP